jgi:hypothetical protein
VEVDVTPIILPVPLPPEKPNTEMIDTAKVNVSENGIWMSYADGRLLAMYLVDIEAYREELLRILDYYKNQGDD